MIKISKKNLSLAGQINDELNRRIKGSMPDKNINNPQEIVKWEEEEEEPQELEEEFREPKFKKQKRNKRKRIQRKFFKKKQKIIDELPNSDSDIF